MTEAQACKDENVFIVGGANSAGQAAMYFSKYAKKVTMLVRAESLTSSMSKYLIDQIAATSNIEVKTQCRVVEALGDGRLACLRLCGNEGEETVPATALFIFIGAAPNTDRPGPEGGREIAQELESGPGSVLARDQLTGDFCSRGCPPWLDQARGIRGR
jgi:thioredoxin reductase (NADPH)